VGLRPYRLLLATQPLRVLRRDAVANLWPLKFYISASNPASTTTPASSAHSILLPPTSSANSATTTAAISGI
jgi:hypothetical protein